VNVSGDVAEIARAALAELETGLEHLRQVGHDSWVACFFEGPFDPDHPDFACAYASLSGHLTGRPETRLSITIEVDTDTTAAFRVEGTLSRHQDRDPPEALSSTELGAYAAMNVSEAESHARHLARYGVARVLNEAATA